MNKFNMSINRKFGVWYINFLRHKVPDLNMPASDAVKRVDDVILKECSNSVFDMVSLLNLVIIVSLLVFGLSHDQ